MLAPLILAALLHAQVPIEDFPGESRLSLAAEENPEVVSDPLSPPVTFRIKEDGLKTLLAGSANEDFLADLRQWQIQIFNFDEEKVAYIQGSGPPSSDRIVWNGAARDGSLLRDGFYTARLVWTDSTGVMQKTPSIQVGLVTSSELKKFLSQQVSFAYSDSGLTLRLAETPTFAPGAWSIQPQSIGTLKQISKFLQCYPRNRLTVQGHADTTGTSGVNKRISLYRARAIYRFLSEHGVDRSRMTYEGRGAEQPIADNATAQGRARNRRVDILLHKAMI